MPSETKSEHNVSRTLRENITSPLKTPSRTRRKLTNIIPSVAELRRVSRAKPIIEDIFSDASFRSSRCLPDRWPEHVFKPTTVTRIPSNTHTANNNSSA